MQCHHPKRQPPNQKDVTNPVSIAYSNQHIADFGCDPNQFEKPQVRSLDNKTRTENQSITAFVRKPDLTSSLQK